MFQMNLTQAAPRPDHLNTDKITQQRAVVPSQALGDSAPREADATPWPVVFRPDFVPEKKKYVPMPSRVFAFPRNREHVVCLAMDQGRSDE
jgi:hypothetical protein